MLFIRVIDDGRKFSYWYIEVSTYYVCNLAYLCSSLLKQQIELVIKTKEFLTEERVN